MSVVKAMSKNLNMHCVAAKHEIYCVSDAVIDSKNYSFGRFVKVFEGRLFNYYRAIQAVLADLVTNDHLFKPRKLKEKFGDKIIIRSILCSVTTGLSRRSERSKCLSILIYQVI